MIAICYCSNTEWRSWLLTILMIKGKYLLKSVWLVRHSNNWYLSTWSTSYYHLFLFWSSAHWCKLLERSIQACACSFSCLNIIKSQSSNVRTNDDQLVIWTVIKTSYSCLSNNIYGSDNFIRFLCLFKYSYFIIKATTYK